MPNIKKKKAFALLSVKSFGGLRDDAGGSESGAVCIKNFRFRTDGSLEKRPGWQVVKSFDQPLRGYWDGTVGVDYSRFAVVGSTVYYLSQYQSPQAVGTLQTSVGTVEFFLYHNRLYLFDGQKIYVKAAILNTFAEAVGYVPLFGNGWSPSTGTGDVNEPLNLLNGRFRVRYSNPSSATKIYLPFVVDSILQVSVNGDTGFPYTYTAGNRYLTLSRSPGNSTVDITMFKTPSHAYRTQIETCMLPFSYHDGDTEYLYLAGGMLPFRVFCATPVSDESLNESTSACADTDPLYIKSANVLTLGDGVHPIHAFCRQNQRVIAFGSSGAWSISRSKDSDLAFSYLLEGCPGCSCDRGVLPLGNDLILLNDAGLCRLESNSSDKDVFKVTCLSKEISGQFRPGEFSHAILAFLPAENQILIRDASESTAGRVFVYHVDLGRWTTYENIFATWFQRAGNRLLFSNGNDLCELAQGRSTDGTGAITAIYESGAISFDSPEEQKRSLRYFAEVSAPGETVTLTLKTETREQNLQTTCAVQDLPELLNLRFAPGRFRTAVFKITATGTNPATLYQIGLYCNL